MMIFVGTNNGTNNTEWVIIPCGGAKADHATVAADLYTGSMFRQALEAARTLTDDQHILILSAKYGLLELDEVVEPYDLKMGQAGSVDVIEIAAQMIGFGIDDDGNDIYTMLPKAYGARFEEAARLLGTYSMDVYEANIGIGEQKAICASVRRTAEAITAA